MSSRNIINEAAWARFGLLHHKKKSDGATVFYMKDFSMWCVFTWYKNTTKQLVSLTLIRYRSQWPSGLRRLSTADRLLGLRVRIPPEAWVLVLCVSYSKGQQAKPGQSGQRSTDKVQKNILHGAWTCDCCVLSGRGLCDWLIPRPEESYRLRCAIVCDVETSRMRRSWFALGCCVREKKMFISHTLKQSSIFNDFKCNML